MKRIILTSCLALTLVAITSTYAHGHKFDHHARTVGAVYTMDNAPDGNNVWVFGRMPDGSLTAPSAVPTEGLGTGGGLGNQGAVQLTSDGRWLLVCNAGSDEISVFHRTPHGLVLTDKADSEGHQPISIAIHGPLVYVLNASGAVGGADNIAGFLFLHGHLLHLPNASYSLSADNTGPADISFTSDGRNIIVTEKATDLIDSFKLGDYGSVTGMSMFPSPVPTPFGFAAGRHNRIYVTEANGGGANPGGSSVSSYYVNHDGDLESISVSVPTHQTAACWVILSGDERFAYTANTPDDSFSSFRVRHNGQLELLESEAATLPTGSGPVDMALSHNGRFLYSLNAGNGTIGAFQMNRFNGALKPLSGADGGMPGSFNGLAAW